MPGIRQRLGLDSREAEAPKEICKFLTGQFASGRMPASDVTMGARAAAVDLGQSSSSSSSSTLQRMATAAPAGERKRKGVTELDTRHCSRGLRRALGASRRSTLPPVVRIPCPLWNKSLNRCELEPVAFLLPHLILSSIPAGKEAEFCEVPGDRQDLAQELREWGARTNVDVESVSVAACGLWGDGAPYDRNDSLQLLIMSIFTGTEGEQMYWLCGIGKNRLCRCGCSGRHTLEPIFRILVWSFSAAAAGVHPRYDHSGNLLAAGTTLGDLASQEFAVRGAMISKRGDWAWHKAVLGMYGWKGEGPSKRICWLCRAGMDPSCTAFDFPRRPLGEGLESPNRNSWRTQQDEALLSAAYGVCLASCWDISRWIGCTLRVLELFSAPVPMRCGSFLFRVEVLVRSPRKLAPNFRP